MPVGLYTRKGKNGRTMYFRNGKLISKKSYSASRTRSSTKMGQRRKGARRAYTNTRKRSTGNPRRKYMKSIPHPSITGMASGLAIAAYLNAGKTVQTGQNGFPISVTTEGVIKDITDGQLGTAFSTLSSNAINMIGSDAGRKTLVTAGLVAMLGAFARSRFPQLKLGGSKLYFRI